MRSRETRMKNAAGTECVRCVRARMLRCPGWMGPRVRACVRTCMHVRAHTQVRMRACMCAAQHAECASMRMRVRARSYTRGVCTRCAHATVHGVARRGVRHTSSLERSVIFLAPVLLLPDGLPCACMCACVLLACTGRGFARAHAHAYTRVLTSSALSNSAVALW